MGAAVAAGLASARDECHGPRQSQRCPLSSAHAFYTSLARLWSLISPVEDYRGEAQGYIDLLERLAPQAQTLLELGSGGGHNAAYLRQRFDMTLSDLNDHMLEVSRVLNPSCEHTQGDMRHLRLNRTFDIVFIHDAIDYMCTEANLLLAMRTAFAHCRPGGVALITPDGTAEVYEEGTDCGGSDGDDGVSVRYLEWTHDPDPNDTQGDVEYAFVVKEADGRVWTLHETHHFGIFPEATWRRLMAEAGFDVDVVDEVVPDDEDRPPRRFFVGIRAR